MGQRAIRNWISRHSYHSAEQTVKNKKLDHRMGTFILQPDVHPFFESLLGSSWFAIFHEFMTDLKEGYRQQ